ncbi:MAG: SIMPL domain-containing protein [Methyloligellaceae bacterium]
MFSSVSMPRYVKLFLFTCLAPLAVSSAFAHDNVRSITLSATGSVTATPDRASINTAVETFDKSAKVAVKQNSEQMAEIIKALKAEGVEKKYIQTTAFSVQPEYESYQSSSKAQRNPEIVGYRVVNSISIFLVDDKKLGVVLDKVVSLGANRISGITFSVSNEEELRDKARKLAMQNAFQRARLYTKSAGTKLGRVTSISETSASVSTGPQTRYRALSKASSVPIEAGSAEISVRVNVTWRLWR